MAKLSSADIIRIGDIVADKLRTTDDKIDQIKQKVDTFGIGQSVLVDAVQVLEDKTRDLDRSVTHLQLQNCKRNVILFGVPENVDTRTAVSTMLATVGDVAMNNVDYFFRLGRPTVDKSRPIKIVLLGQWAAEAVISKRKQLSEANIVVKPDLPFNMRQLMQSNKSRIDAAFQSNRKSKVHWRGTALFINTESLGDACGTPGGGIKERFHARATQDNPSGGQRTGSAAAYELRSGGRPAVGGAG
jgi:hypothetical protein